MARHEDRAKALALRKRGMSYSQIKEVLNVSKSTLSLWLRDYPLSKKRVHELQGKGERKVERFRETMRLKREKRLREIFEGERQQLGRLSKRELYLVGLALYWGEGLKSRSYALSVSNTDPDLINFFIRWLRETLDIPIERMRAVLHLYKEMDIKEETKYWSQQTGIPVNQFTKPYIKESRLSAVNHKGGFGHGTCNVRVNDTRLTEKVLMGIKVLTE